MQSASPLSHELSSSVEPLTRMIGAPGWPQAAISSSTVVYFSMARNSFKNSGAKHASGCGGAHGVGWLSLCFCAGPLACRGTRLSPAYAHFNLCRQLWLCHLGAQHAFTWAQQAYCPSCLLH